MRQLSEETGWKQMLKKKKRVTMHFNYTCRAIWFLCVITTLSASPLPVTNDAAMSSDSTKEVNEKWAFENQRHRQKRQLSTFIWNSDFLQSLGQAFTDTVGRLRGFVSNNVSVAQDSTLGQMVNDFRTRVAPAILRSVYLGTVQNIWDQIRQRARTTINDLLDRTVGT